MNHFAYTPTFVDELGNVTRDPIVSKWQIRPILFNVTTFPQTYHPLDSDRSYQKRVIKDVYFRLTNKWLANSSIFQPLLAYFRVEHDGDDRRVSVINDIGDKSTGNVSPEDRKYVYQYIARVFISKKLVDRAVRRTVEKYNMHWYDILVNSRHVKKQAYRYLHKLIRKTVENLE